MSQPEYIELNMVNYNSDEVLQLNQWGIWAAGRIEELESMLANSQSWQCGCGHTNGVNLATCAMCNRSPASAMGYAPMWKEQP